jgi:hypothetical protein
MMHTTRYFAIGTLFVASMGFGSPTGDGKPSSHVARAAA